MFQQAGLASMRIGPCQHYCTTRKACATNGWIRSWKSTYCCGVWIYLNSLFLDCDQPIFRIFGQDQHLTVASGRFKQRPVVASLRHSNIAKLAATPDRESPATGSDPLLWPVCVPRSFRFAPDRGPDQTTCCTSVRISAVGGLVTARTPPSH